MAADSSNRETVRDAFATLLTTDLTGGGNPVQTVYNYKKGVFKESPVILVFSGPVVRRQWGKSTEKWRSSLVLHVWVFVADADEDNSYTEQDVEDTLDLVEKGVADVVAENRNTADWTYLTFDETEGLGPMPATVDGAPYILEMLRVRAEVVDT